MKNLTNWFKKLRKQVRKIQKWLKKIIPKLTASRLKYLRFIQPMKNNIETL